MATFSPLMSPLVWDLGQIAAFEDLWLEQHHGDRLGGVQAGPLEMGAPPHGFAYDRGDSKRPGDPTADGRRWRIGGWATDDPGPSVVHSRFFEAETFACAHSTLANLGQLAVAHVSSDVGRSGAQRVRT